MEPQNPAASNETSSRRSPIAAAICVVMLAGFVVMSYTAVIQKSATADEPLHALGAYMHTFRGDFRLNSEDPPLWKYWAMLPHLSRGAGALHVDLDSELWKGLPGYIWNGTKFVTQTMYRTEGNDPDAFINRSRVMMLLIGVALGTLITVWAWQLAGPVAAVLACALYSFDPSFLGHAPLVKDDVPFTLAMAGLVWATWRAGEWLTPSRAIVIAVFLAVGLNAKFSGVLLVPIAAALLLARAWVIPGPWKVLNRELSTRRARLTAAIAMLALGAAVSFFGIWASYGFRFRPTPDPDIRLNMPLIAEAVTWTDYVAHDPEHHPPRPDQLAAQPPRAAVSVALWLDRHELLPQAWLAGFLDTYKTTMLNQSYLLGRINRSGAWYYFPLAMLFKTPTATLIACVVAVAVVAFRARAGKKQTWSMLCLWLPIVVYVLPAITSSLNLGLRHILPIYPLLLLLVAVALAPLWKRRGGKILLSAIGVALAVESVAAYPNYIAFFNSPSGGSRGGFGLLGDSNLDWGQDLSLLTRWHREHPDTPLYVAYFGMADPGRYLNSYTPLPGNSRSLPLSQPPAVPGVLAISATNLQGIYLDEPTRAMYRRIYEDNRPIEVLGGTIYLYRIDDQVLRDWGAQERIGYPVRT